MLVVYAHVQSFVLCLVDRWRRRRDQQGQTTAEYALVLLGAAAVAMLFVVWAARTDRISRLLDAVMDQVLSRSRR